MSEPFIGEIKMVGFTFNPRGWANCDGQLLPIAQNTALFSLFGTTYGGDGRTTFALPDLRGRVPVHTGNGPGLSPKSQGQESGQESVTLNINEIPSHTHNLIGSTDEATKQVPTNNVLADSRLNTYGSPTVDNATALSASSIQSSGGGQSHNNMQPYLVIRFVVALQGLFPSRN